MTTYHDTTGQTCTACVKVAASPICGAEQSDWVCTREPGHDSVHIACGARHGAAYWVKEPTAASTAPVCCGPLDEDVAFWHARWHEAADQRDDRDAAAYAWKEAARRLSIRARARWSFCDFLLSERTRADKAMIRMSARLSEAEKRAAKAEQERSDAWEQLEHRDRELATAEAHRDEAQLLAADQIAEAQAEATEAVIRAEKAEKELDEADRRTAEAEEKRDRWKRHRDRVDGQWAKAEREVTRLRAAQPRPLTPDDFQALVQKSEVAIARRVRALDPSRNFQPSALRLADAIYRGIRDSQRPEGAEELETVIGLNAGKWTNGAADIRALADLLAERGVRVTGTDR